MDGREIYRRQTTVVNNLLKGFIGDLRPGEWEARPAPHTNTIGFNAWHIPATQDWAVNTWVGGQLGLNSSAEWAAKGMAVSPAPFGMDLEVADAIAAAVSPRDVLDYADTVTARTLAWLDSLDETALDEVPATNRLHLDKHPAYSTPGYREETEPMFAYPLWRLLSGACYGHARGHFGELDLALAIVRSRG